MLRPVGVAYLRLPGQLVLRLLDQPLDHVATHIAIVPGAEITIVALLEVDTQLPGNLKLHVVQRAPRLRHHPGRILILIHALLTSCSLCQSYCDRESRQKPWQFHENWPKTSVKKAAAAAKFLPQRFLSEIYLMPSSC